MIITLWMRLAMYAAIVAAVVGIGWSVHHHIDQGGYQRAVMERDAADKEAIAKRLIENEALADKNALDAQKASQDHANEIEAVKRTAIANAGKRVPVDPRICRPSGPTESTASGSDEQDNSAAAFLPIEFTDSLRQAAAFADEITADMRTLVRRVEDAGCFR